MSHSSVLGARRTWRSSQRRPLLSISITVAAMIVGISLCATSVFLTIGLGVGPRDEVTADLNTPGANLRTVLPASTMLPDPRCPPHLGVSRPDVEPLRRLAQDYGRPQAVPHLPQHGAGAQLPVTACSALVCPSRAVGTCSPPFITVSGSRHEPFISIRQH